MGLVIAMSLSLWRPRSPILPMVLVAAAAATLARQPVGRRRRRRTAGADGRSPPPSWCWARCWPRRPGPCPTSAGPSCSATPPTPSTSAIPCCCRPGPGLAACAPGPARPALFAAAAVPACLLAGVAIHLWLERPMIAWAQRRLEDRASRPRGQPFLRRGVVMKNPIRGAMRWAAAALACLPGLAAAAPTGGLPSPILMTIHESWNERPATGPYATTLAAVPTYVNVLGLAFAPAGHDLPRRPRPVGRRPFLPVLRPGAARLHRGAEEAQPEDPHPAQRRRAGRRALDPA